MSVDLPESAEQQEEVEDNDADESDKNESGSDSSRPDGSGRDSTTPLHGSLKEATSPSDPTHVQNQNAEGAAAVTSNKTVGLAPWPPRGAGSGVALPGGNQFTSRLNPIRRTGATINSHVGINARCTNCPELT